MDPKLVVEVLLTTGSNSVRASVSLDGKQGPWVYVDSLSGIALATELSSIFGPTVVRQLVHSAGELSDSDSAGDWSPRERGLP